MAIHLQNRLYEVKDNEVAAGVCDSQNNPIRVKSGCKDERTVRVIFYQQITDELTELAIKKVVYVMKELEM
jgi:hypothetical protein